MAIWQFDSYIIPKESLDKKYYTNDEKKLFWGSRDIKLEKLDFLEQEESWSDNILLYGKHDETCIEFLYEGESLAEISCRMDLRSLSKQLLVNICEYVKDINGVFLYGTKIVIPETEEMIAAINISKAKKYIENPVMYIKNID